MQKTGKCYSKHRIPHYFRLLTSCKYVRELPPVPASVATPSPVNMTNWLHWVFECSKRASAASTIEVETEEEKGKQKAEVEVEQLTW